MPKPSKACFLGANKGDFEFLDNATDESVNCWGAGNLSLKKGDIALLYCLAPRSNLHSIWRVLDDSFINPFSFYYYAVRVGFPVKSSTITLNELKKDSVLGTTSVVKSNMQGMNGKPFSSKAYQKILKMNGMLKFILLNHFLRF